MMHTQFSRSHEDLVKGIAFTVLLALMTQTSAAQTMVDLKRQARNIDFAGSASARVFPAGAALPATCLVGEGFVKLTDPDGAGLYLCTAADQWNKLGGASSGLTAGPGIVVVGTQIAVEDAVVPMYMTGAGAPTVPCLPGRDRYLDISSGQSWECTGANQWSQRAHLNQANLWASGKRQQMQPSLAAAGLNVGSMEGSPSSLVDGDIWHDASAGKLKCRQGGTTVDCVTEPYSTADTRKASWNEEFTRRGATDWGELGWELQEDTAGDCAAPGRRTQAQHPALVALGVVASLQSGCTLILGQSEAVLPPLAPVTGWEFRWVFAPDGSDNVQHRVGITNPLAGLGTTTEEGAWMTISVTGGVVTAAYEVATGTGTVSAAVPEATTVGTTWYTFRLRSTSSGTWLFSASQNGGDFGTEVSACPSGCALTVTLPTSALSPFVQVRNATGSATAHELLVDAWKGQMVVSR